MFCVWSMQGTTSETATESKDYDSKSSIERTSANSKFDRTGCTTGLALEQGGPILFHEVRIRGLALAALDVGIDVIGDCLFDPLWWDTPLETSPWPVTRTRSSQFIEEVLIDVIIVSVHHRDHFIEVAENCILTFDKNLWRRQSPS